MCSYYFKLSFSKSDYVDAKEEEIEAWTAASLHPTVDAVWGLERRREHKLAVVYSSISRTRSRLPMFYELISLHE